MQDKPTLTEAEWAWLAGLFEGEGCFNFHSKRSVAVVIKMTDHDVLESVNRLAPSVSGILPIKRRDDAQPHHKPQYQWGLTARDDVIWFIEGILPWLHMRRGARAQEALERLATNRGWHSGNTHCRNGHVWTDAGVYVSPQGKRMCNACRRESADRYRARYRERYLKNHREAERLRRRRRAET